MAKTKKTVRKSTGAIAPVVDSIEDEGEQVGTFDYRGKTKAIFKRADGRKYFLRGSKKTKTNIYPCEHCEKIFYCILDIELHMEIVKAKDEAVTCLQVFPFGSVSSDYFVFYIHRLYMSSNEFFKPFAFIVSSEFYNEIRSTAFQRFKNLFVGEAVVDDYEAVVEEKTLQLYNLLDVGLICANCESILFELFLNHREDVMTNLNINWCDRISGIDHSYEMFEVNNNVWRYAKLDYYNKNDGCVIKFDKF